MYDITVTVSVEEWDSLVTSERKRLDRLREALAESVSGESNGSSLAIAPHVIDFAIHASEERLEALRRALPEKYRAK
jgi:hypothetical protein